MVTIFGKEIGNVTKGDRAKVITAMISKKPEITVNDMAESLNLTRRTVLRELKQLIVQQRINRKGGRKSGYWQIVE